MASPFPGVDPYLERSGAWPGFHHALITYCRDALNDTLPEHYAAIIEERVQLVDLDADTRRTRLRDIGVVRDEEADRSKRTGDGSATIAAAMRITLTLPEYVEDTQGYINVVRLPEHELVTSIEILSPSNKVSPGSGEYVMKRRSMLAQGVSLVELDLLLEGDRLELREPLPTGDFFAFVSRANQRPTCQVYSWSLRQPIPTLPIPLKSPDADVPLDFLSVFARAYERGRYARSLPYRNPPPLNLPPGELAWAVQQASVAAT